MGRAHGKRNPVRPGGFADPDPGPDSPEGHETGESARQDPAGWVNAETGNIVNYETVRQQVAVPEPPEQFRGMMAHGVPPEHDTTEERAQAERGGPNAARTRRVPAGPVHPRPPAVPVYLVESEGGPESFRTAYPRHVTVPANTGADPVRVCGRDPRRNRIGLLNEDGTTDIRFAQAPGGLTNGGGSILFHGVTTYQWFETQDELYAVTVSSTLSVVLSVIEEFEQEL